MKQTIRTSFKAQLFTGVLLFYGGLLFAQTGNLPEWFLKLENFNSYTTAIGVSSPNPDSVSAFKQAKIRALLNYSILHNSRLRSLTTLSLGDQKNTTRQADNIQYIIYTNILTGELPLIDSLNEVEHYYNQYKEAFVRIKIPLNYSKDSLKLSYTLTRKAAFQREQNNFPVSVDELEFTIQSRDSLIEHFHVERDGVKMFNTSYKKPLNFFDGTEISKKCFYGLSGSTLGETSDNSTLPCPLYTGVWNSYIFNLVDQICILNQFDQDLQYKLTTSNLANLNAKNENTSYQQFVYTLKNVNSSECSVKINKIGVSDNLLHLGVISQSSTSEISDSYSASDKYDKKEMKKLYKENWMVYKHPDFSNAWLNSKSLIKNVDYINSAVDVSVNNLQAGILEAVNIAKLELSSQLGSKINTLNSSNNSNDEQLYLNTSKLSNYKKTGKISPQFIFYSKINNSLYRIRVVLFYKLI